MGVSDTPKSCLYRNYPATSPGIPQRIEQVRYHCEHTVATTFGIRADEASVQEFIASAGGNRCPDCMFRKRMTRANNRRWSRWRAARTP